MFRSRPHAEDHALARRVARGDAEAFRELFDTSFPRVYRFCRARLPDDEMVIEEVVQNTLLAGIRHAGSYRGEAALLTWLCQIARREISRRLRRDARRRDVLLLEDHEEVRAALQSMAADDDPESIARAAETRAGIQSVLDHLPVQYGNLLEWKYVEGLSVDEIAARLGTTSIAVQSKLARARSTFRREFAALGAAVSSAKGAKGGSGA